MKLTGSEALPECGLATSPREPKDMAYAIAEDITGLPRDAMLVRNGIKTYIRRDWATIGADQALWQEIADE